MSIVKIIYFGVLFLIQFSGDQFLYQTFIYKFSPFVKENDYHPPEHDILQAKARGEDPGLGQEDSDFSEDEDSGDSEEEGAEDSQPAKKVKKII